MRKRIKISYLYFWDSPAHEIGLLLLRWRDNLARVAPVRAPVENTVTEGLEPRSEGLSCTGGKYLRFLSMGILSSATLIEGERSVCSFWGTGRTGRDFFMVSRGLSGLFTDRYTDWFQLPYTKSLRINLLGGFRWRLQASR
jgi:hypothetical protein